MANENEHDQDRLPSSLSQNGPEVILAWAKKYPEFRSRAFQTLFRQQLIQILNQLSVQNTDRAVRELTLGLEYVQEKKGLEGVQEYLRRGDLGTCIAIGKKIMLECFHGPLNDLLSKNEILVEGKELTLTDREEAVFIQRNPCFSGFVREFLREMETRSVSHLPELRYWKQQCDSMAEYVRFIKEELKIDSDLFLKAIDIPRSSLKTILTANSDLGSGEIGIFISVFENVFPGSRETPLALNKSAAEKFFQCFDASGNFNPEIVQDLLSACQKSFPDFPQAVQLLRYFLRNYPNTLSSFWTQDSSTDQQLKLKYFPGKTVSREALLDSDITEDKKLESGQSSSAPSPLLMTFPQVEALPKKTLQKMVKQFPYLGAWHVTLLSCREQGREKDFLEMILRSSESHGMFLARKLWLGFLSLEPEAIQVPVEDLLTDKEFQNLSAIKLLRQLPDVFQTFVAKHENNYKPLESEIESIDGTKGHRHHDPIAAISPLLSPRYWHPHFQEEPLLWNRERGADRITQVLSETDNIEQKREMIRYLIRPECAVSPETWSTAFCDALQKNDHTTSFVFCDELPEETLVSVLLENVVIIMLPALRADEEEETRLDIPLNLLMGKKPDCISLPFEGNEKYFLSRISKRGCRVLFRFASQNKSKFASDFLDDNLFSDELSFLLTRTPSIREQDIPSWEKLYLPSRKRILTILIQKFKVSSKAVQNKIIAMVEKKSPEDAALLQNVRNMP